MNLPRLPHISQIAANDHGVFVLLSNGELWCQDGKGWQEQQHPFATEAKEEAALEEIKDEVPAGPAESGESK